MSNSSYRRTEDAVKLKEKLSREVEIEKLNIQLDAIKTVEEEE